MPPKKPRLVITPADVKSLLTCSHATATRKLIFARQVFGKQKHQLISIKEFCNFYGLDFEESIQKINP